MNLDRRGFLGLVAGLALEAKKKEPKEKNPDPVWQAGVTKWLGLARQNDREIAEVFLHSPSGYSSLDRMQTGSANGVVMHGQTEYLQSKLTQGLWVADIHIHPVKTLKDLHGFSNSPARPELISPPYENGFKKYGSRGDIAYLILQRAKLQELGVSHEGLVHGVVDNSGVWLFNINMRHPFIQKMSELLQAQARGDKETESLIKKFVKEFGAELIFVGQIYDAVYAYNHDCFASGDSIYGERRPKVIYTVISRLNTVGVNMLHYNAKEALTLNQTLIEQDLRK
jgi:hypothetical protein